VTKLQIELDVAPESLSESLKTELATEARKYAVLDLMRRGRLTQSRAAELLGVTRAELFDLMTQADVAHIDLRPGEVEQDAVRVADDHRHNPA